MVSPKKVIKQVPRDDKKVAPAPKPTEVKLRVDRLTKTVRVTEDPVALRELLDSAPEVPYITKIEEAVTFVDKYAKWKARAKTR